MSIRKRYKFVNQSSVTGKFVSNKFLNQNTETTMKRKVKTKEVIKSVVETPEGEHSTTEKFKAVHVSSGKTVEVHRKNETYTVGGKEVRYNSTHFRKVKQK